MSKRSGDRISVRQFRPDDAEETSAVMQAAFRSFLKGKASEHIFENMTPERFRNSSTYRTKNPTSVSYVAEVNGKIVGYVSGTINPCGFGTLSVIGVSPSCFHGGIGTRLMRKMVAFWRKNKMRKASTCVSAHNARAIGFYLKHGFVPVGYRRDHFIEGVDEILLDRFLN